MSRILAILFAIFTGPLIVIAFVLGHVWCDCQAPITVIITARIIGCVNVVRMNPRAVHQCVSGFADVTRFAMRGSSSAQRC